tara:strand:- start:38 stop:658 length:621 start_codon:yes stop_codon:yes gene_type:complete
MNNMGIAMFFLLFGIFLGSISGYFNLNPQVSQLEEKLVNATQKIENLEQNIRKIDESNMQSRISLSLKIAEMANTLSEREGVWIPKYFEDPPLYYDNSVLVLANVQCKGGGGSMKPTFDCSDLVFGYEPELKDIEIGDIIVFKERSGPLCETFTGDRIIHRIEEIKHDLNNVEFKTKGDANNISDPCLVQEEDIELRIVSIIYNAK